MIPLVCKYKLWSRFSTGSLNSKVFLPVLSLKATETRVSYKLNYFNPIAYGIVSPKVL